MSKQPLYKRYGLELLLVIGLLALYGLYSSTFSSNFKSSKSQFQSVFIDKCNKLDRLLLYEKHRFEHFGLENIWEHKVDEDFNLHIYRKDSLKFWSTNELPILRFADIHFPDQGILHLQNGWYYAKTIEVNKVTFCASFLIKKDYSYENKDLENHFASDFKLPFDGNISLDGGDFEVLDQSGTRLFSIVHNTKQVIGAKTNSFFLILILCCALLTLFIILKWIRRFFPRQKFVVSISALLVLRWVVFMLPSGNELNQLEFFQPSLFALSDTIPNFISYCLNVVMLVTIAHLVFTKLKDLKPSRKKRIVLLFLLFGFYLFWNVLIYFIEGLIENSSIPMRMDQLFELNFYSIVAFVSIGFLFQSYFRIVKLACKEISIQTDFQPTFFVLIFITTIGYFIYDINYGLENFICAVFPGIFITVAALFYRSDSEGRVEFIHGMVCLFLLCCALTSLISALNVSKERSVRELYANQLQTDKDILTELEFEKVKKNIDNDAFLQKLTAQKQNISLSDIHDALENRLFDGFWEQYEMDFFLYDAKGAWMMPGTGVDKVAMDDLIANHGKMSEVDAAVFYIADFAKQYSYVLKHGFEPNPGQVVTLYIAFKSKRIPEEIGFPRLLISENARVFKSLEKYSIAKYYNQRLITNYGDYHFPVLLSAFKIPKTASQGYLERGDFNHFFLKRGQGNYIFLSVRNLSWIDVLTAFSYLFCFYGLLLLPLLFRRKQPKTIGYNFTLAMKIQMVMIAMVFVSLVIYGWGSGIFVRSQYNAYSNQIISEKLNSVTMEFQSKFSQKDSLVYNPNGDLELALQKFAKVFVTDINFYDPKGYLVASSRPKVYNVGLLSEQMNPSAMTAMKVRNESEFVHQEKIGKLNYASAYQPFFDVKGEVVGFLNLQHFGQQKDFEAQIQQFLMAIINVFMFLLAISAVVAILVSGWLTAPLRLIQERFAQVNFGRLNEPIIYEKEDEIGALVQEYNRKIDELALTAQLLAKNERENAWREMAKQVAHEIKNPLTPMKLSLQHFQRIYDPKNPVSQNKLNQMVASLVEQIDGLTRIANEFSNFAKMPNPNEEAIDLNVLIPSVIEVFRETSKVNYEANIAANEVVMHADKDMMIRILNNLIKNAIQASEDAAQTTVRLLYKNAIIIEVEDQGCGMSQEVQKKLFVPYFTTKSTGTGLGLAMVKQMVELHKGKIDVRSIEGKGTTFRIEFPQ